MHLILRALAGALVVLAMAAPAFGQQTDRDDILRVFVDCQGFHCDVDHFRREIDYVHYMRDRQDADVHVLITRERTGSGGRAYTLTFIGQDDYADTHTTLTYASSQTDTDTETRDGLTRTIAVGLLPLVARTSVIDDLHVDYSPPDGEAAAEQTVEDDPWNYWIFSTRARTRLEAESRTRDYDLEGSFSANRTTENLKVDVGVDGEYSESRFDVDDTTTVVDVQKDYSLETLIVKSLSDHWSAGGRAEANASTFVNRDLLMSVAPAIEYDLFPYSISTRRQLRFLYEVTLSTVDYTEETIFNKTSETLLSHRLSATLDVRQPWGSVRASVNGIQYLHDLSKNRLRVFSDVEVRLFRGLSVNLFGSVSLVRDQLFLPKEDATAEEVLLQRRQLATDFEYFVSFGLSYTFGSIYNNVVNPRFGD